jgi:hypothetical protein
MKPKQTATRVAEWMLKELKRQGKLHQNTVVYEIAEKFGSQFTYDNKDGNLAIRIDVLVAFRNLTKDSVVWVRGDSYWRMRDPHDGPGRLGVYERRFRFDGWL